MMSIQVNRSHCSNEVHDITVDNNAISSRLADHEMGYCNPLDKELENFSLSGTALVIRTFVEVPKNIV